MRKVPEPEQRPRVCYLKLLWLVTCSHQVVHTTWRELFLYWFVQLCLRAKLLSGAYVTAPGGTLMGKSRWHANIFWQSGIMAGLNHVIVPELGIITNPIIF